MATTISLLRLGFDIVRIFGTIYASCARALHFQNWLHWTFIKKVFTALLSMVFEYRILQLVHICRLVAVVVCLVAWSY